MDKQIAQYIRSHIVFVTTVVVVGFFALAAGEYYLYRQIMYLNKMISEGFMQVKSAQEVKEIGTGSVDEVDVIMER